MEKKFYSSNDKFEFDGQGAFEDISLHTNKSFNPRKNNLKLKIDGEPSPIERGLMDINNSSTNFYFMSEESFVLSFEGLEKDEIILMKYEIVDPPRFI